MHRPERTRPSVVGLAARRLHGGRPVASHRGRGRDRRDRHVRRRGWPVLAARPRAAQPNEPLTVGAGHAHPLYLDGTAPVHRLPAEVGIVCAVVFVFAVVATPREAFWAFAGYLAILIVIWRIAGIALTWIGPRMLIELPFVTLALLLPFAEGGARVTVLGLSLSVAGLYAAWGIL